MMDSGHSGTYILDSYTVNFYFQYILVSTSIISQVSVIQEIMLFTFSISVYLSSVTITIILKLIQIDEQLLQVSDYISKLAFDTCYKREEVGVEKKEKEMEMVDFLAALTRFCDLPTIHYESEEPGLLTHLFDTCDDNSNEIITITGKNTPKCPSFVIVSMFVSF